MFDSQHTQKMEQPKFHRAGLLGLWKRKNRVSFKLIKKPKKNENFFLSLFILLLLIRDCGRFECLPL